LHTLHQCRATCIPQMIRQAPLQSAAHRSDWPLLSEERSVHTCRLAYSIILLLSSIPSLTTSSFIGHRSPLPFSSFAASFLFAPVSPRSRHRTLFSTKAYRPDALMIFRFPPCAQSVLRAR